jgi:hypothetical protein
MIPASKLTWSETVDGTVRLCRDGSAVAIAWPDGRRWRVSATNDPGPGETCPTRDEAKAAAMAIARNLMPAARHHTNLRSADVIDDRTIERLALDLELPFSAVVRVARALLEGGIMLAVDGDEPADPWERLFYWEARVRAATGPASAAAADSFRQAARICISVDQVRSQIDASYRRGKARGYSEGVVAGFDEAKSSLAAAIDVEPAVVRDHRAVIQARQS